MKLNSSLSKNIIANTLSKFWSIISVYLFVPIWINLLGIEGYGIIGFYTVMVSLLSFADAGLSSAMTREFARESLHNDNYKSSLLKTTELIYLFIAISIIILINIYSEWISSSFLNTNTIPLEKRSLYIRLMGIILSTNLLFILYSGCLMGIKRQIACNLLNIGYSISRSALVLIPLYFYPTVETFLYWQLFSIIATTVLARYYIFSSLKSEHKGKINFQLIKNIWRFSLGMMFMAIIGSVNTQMDKLIIGRLLPLKELGLYTLASTVGQSVTLLIIPLGQAFYPELTNLLSKHSLSDFKHYFILFSSLVSIVSCSVGFTLFFFNYSYVYIWTSDINIASSILIPSRILILANIFLALQYSPYYLALSYGYTKTNIQLGLFFLFITIPLTYYLCNNYGMIGASIPFLLLNIIALFFLSYSLMHRFLSDLFGEWIYYSMLQPIIICITIIGVGYYLYPSKLFSINAILYSVALTVISVYISFYYICKKYRQWIFLSDFKRILKLYPRLNHKL